MGFCRTSPSAGTETSNTRSWRISVRIQASKIKARSNIAFSTEITLYLQSSHSFVGFPPPKKYFKIWIIGVLQYYYIIPPWQIFHFSFNGFIRHELFETPLIRQSKCEALPPSTCFLFRRRGGPEDRLLCQSNCQPPLTCLHKVKTFVFFIQFKLNWSLHFGHFIQTF